jgi:uncharacterized DUF497 family protein
VIIMYYIFNRPGSHMKIEVISWDQETVDHIARHGVTPLEVEEVLFNDTDSPLFLRSKAGRYLAYGRTNAGRFLLIVWALMHRKTRIVTARDMTGRERRFYTKRKR